MSESPTGKDTQALESSPRWQQEGYEHIWMPYCQMQTSPLPLPVDRTEGVYLYTSSGRQIMDGLASWWSACHGYNHPAVIDAVSRQLQQMPHVMFGGINHSPALRLARRLATLAPGDLSRVFFSDSGSVAVEVAMKIAVQYWRNLGDHSRNRFVSFRHAYHGDTTGAMSLCDPVTSMHRHFKGFLLEQFPSRIPETSSELAEFRKFVKHHADDTAAVIIEPLVQGAGGMRFHSAESLASIRDVCRELGILLIADEIATGFGRTGTMFASEQADVVPDILCVGKALTAGTMGLAATLATEEVFATFQSEDPAKALMHGPTFMANPLACAAANASLDLFDSEPRLAQAKRLEAELREGLADCSSFPGVVNVRCLGAIGVVEVERLVAVETLRRDFLEQGIWIRPFAGAVYVTPALTMSTSESAFLTEGMRNVLKQWCTKHFAE